MTKKAANWLEKSERIFKLRAGWHNGRIKIKEEGELEKGGDGIRSGQASS